MTEQEMRDWIDNASLEQLLSKWRFSKPGNPFFQGEVGDHYTKVMFGMRDADPVAWTAASKSVGWD